ncbi:hypothetical protein SDC9_195420 [bioreactor metagenome]|uniref:Uncharacterized protein n=1 Tax=bioreactor metagenome TaxID=1076179 RepID=A0A645IA87_9ZZZZ
MPKRATPTVPIVLHDDPVARDTTEHTKTDATKNIFGDKIFNPQ